jgi:hypothetical protein
MYQENYMVKQKRLTKKVLFAKTIEILQQKLNLQDWLIVVKFSRNMKTALADCRAQPEYRQATIRLSLIQSKNYPYYGIVAAAIHEMMHCIVWPLTQLTEDFSKKDKHKLELVRRCDESVITHLERAFTDTALPYLQAELLKQGYPDIMPTFENVRVSHEKPKVKRVVKKR